MRTIECQTDSSLEMNLPEEVKIRLQCTTVYKREDDDQVYDYR